MSWTASPPVEVNDEIVKVAISPIIYSNINVQEQIKTEKLLFLFINDDFKVSLFCKYKKTNFFKIFEYLYLQNLYCTKSNPELTCHQTVYRIHNTCMYLS